MKSHSFNPGDIVRSKPGSEIGGGILGIVRDVNDLEVIVCWQQVDGEYVGTWDTYPDEVEFVCHIPEARLISETQDQLMTLFQKEHGKKMDEIIKVLESAQVIHQALESRAHEEQQKPS